MFLDIREIYLGPTFLPATFYLKIIFMFRPNSPNISYTIECYICPGLSWSLDKQREFVTELREVVIESFGFTDPSQLPAYQCLVWPDGTPEGASLDNKVIAVARERTHFPSKGPGKMLGFNSAVLLPILGLPSPVLHLGLTCIIPSARSYGLTKSFTTRIITLTFLRLTTAHSQKLWITSLACVVSSLGNVAREFDNVWPSPAHPNGPPSEMHAHIAAYIAQSPNLRKELYIPSGCIYDADKSVFQGSVKGTVFSKERNDERYHHRSGEMNKFYDSRIDWERGDEVLEIWNISLTNVVLMPLRMLLFPLRGRWGLPAVL